MLVLFPRASARRIAIENPGLTRRSLGRSRARIVQKVKLADKPGSVRRLAAPRQPFI